MPSTKFSDFVGAFEADSDEETRRELDEWRGRYDIAHQLLVLRSERGWTQLQLAEASGLQQAEVSRIETGSANPTRDTLMKLGRPFGVTVSFVRASGEAVSA